MSLRIKEILKEKNIQINELSEMIKLSPQNLSKLINEKTKPSIETFEKIATALNVPITDLFERPKENVIHCPNCGVELELKKKESLCLE